MLSEYNQIIKDQLQADVTEHITIRIVYDASSKIGNSPSLNDCLLPGLSLTANLYGVLIRFRLHRYAFSADIENAFLQIILDESHRNFVRFFYISKI